MLWKGNGKSAKLDEYEGYLSSTHCGLYVSRQRCEEGVRKGQKLYRNKLEFTTVFRSYVKTLDKFAEFSLKVVDPVRDPRPRCDGTLLRGT